MDQNESLNILIKKAEIDRENLINQANQLIDEANLLGRAVKAFKKEEVKNGETNGDKKGSRVRAKKRDA